MPRAGGGSRRIIYIRNPSSGSNFRTIGSGRAGAPPLSPKQPKPKKPKPPKTPTAPDYADNGMGGANGYMPGYQTPKSWFIHSPSQAALNYGNYSGPGIGPYEQTFTPTFIPPETLLGEFYDIYAGMAPGGNIQWGYGTQGTFVSGNGWDDLILEGIDRHATERNPLFFGGTGTLPSTYLNPNRNNKRPWWAQ